MHVIRAMAADAGGRRLAIGRPLMVAALAGERGMRVAEREIRESVVEGGAAQIDDVRIAPPMLAVAGETLARLGAARAAVKALAGAQVRGHVLVTIEAKCGLTGSIGLVMARAALLLGLGVRLGYGPGHQQRLDAGTEAGG